MATIAIYYQMKEKQQTEEAIEIINRFIRQLQTEHVIKGVFIDRYAERNEFYELLHSASSKINILFLEKPVEDEFDKKLLLAVIQTENIQVKYFSEFISSVE
ncbi:TPP-dependent 2-oxoacid decarboxylase [Anoxybacillus voinovskiensis]|uniref:TPP-dependent 2-oxoacid decarboxylase n=1 Tax=Anoxybacteroides voinovskiense TaxID=230470 RepID=A0A840DN23_9BACL|nr:hypothetical protein [Anoxybacillus voinovskiensis]MBB4073035.1 TPP-dependent 2-oxoacid decarboxylase [Anoxybacillus voinovskiensis]GGJ59942.1 hypothetical protein GCM10008982_06310 [Anoxybacillus voinovskiensis]